MHLLVEEVIPVSLLQLRKSSRVKMSLSSASLPLILSVRVTDSNTDERRT